MELYVKAGPNGEIGDCPFAHFVRCILNAKKLDYKVIPCNKSNKPDWLVKDDALCGKMPCLKDGETKVVESGDIAKYIESKWPEPRLSADNNASMDQILAPIFPAFAKFMKNPEHCPDREQCFLSALATLEAYLAAHEDRFLGVGSGPSLADYSIAPKLQHVLVTTVKFTPGTRTKMMEACPNLLKYMNKMDADEAFAKAKPTDDLIIWGWSEARK